MLDLTGLHLRAALLQSIRKFFLHSNFLEVDTPVRQPVLIPESTILPLRSESCFLQTSPEQYMKRLLALGAGRIFQICRCFRKDERGCRHLEEFTMLEWYRLDADYLDLMDDCRQLLQFVIEDLHTTAGFKKSIMQSCFGQLDFGSDWQRLSVDEAFAGFCPVPLVEALATESFDEMIVEYVEPHLGFERPCFLYDYPASRASLARRKSDDDSVAERFELYIQGVELANGFSELTDPDEQRFRFEEEITCIRAQGGDADMPERFLRDLQKIDTAAGIAFGVERLLMLIMSADSINDVVPFSPDEW